MSSREEVQRDIDEFLEKQDTLNREARKALLFALFDKHICLSKSDLMLDLRDLHEVKSIASSRMSSIALPAQISGKEVYQEDLRSIVLLESFGMQLNKHQALRRVPKFNFTQGG